MLIKFFPSLLVFRNCFSQFPPTIFSKNNPFCSSIPKILIQSANISTTNRNAAAWGPPIILSGWDTNCFVGQGCARWLPKQPAQSAEAEPVAARPRLRLCAEPFGGTPAWINSFGQAQIIFSLMIYSASIAKNSPSLRIVIVPSFLALSSFEPASSPTTK